MFNKKKEKKKDFFKNKSYLEILNGIVYVALDIWFILVNHFWIIYVHEWTVWTNQFKNDYCK